MDAWFRFALLIWTTSTSYDKKNVLYIRAVNLRLLRYQRLSQRAKARRGHFLRHPFYRGSVSSHSRAGINLSTAIKYPQCTATQRPEHCATQQRTGHLDQVSAAQNDRRRGQRPEPMPGITRLPLHHKRPISALFSGVLIRQQAE
jgi:hypothetical protein